MSLKDKIKHAANNLSSLDLFCPNDKEFIVSICNDFNSRVRVIKAYFDFSEKANLELKELRSKVNEKSALGCMYFLPSYGFEFQTSKSYDMLVSEFMSVVQSYFSEKYMLGKFLIDRNRHENGLGISNLQPNELDANEIAKKLYAFMNNAPFEQLADFNAKTIALGIIALEGVKMTKKAIVLNKFLSVNTHRGNAYFEPQSNFHYFLRALMLFYEFKGNMTGIEYNHFNTSGKFIELLGGTYYLNLNLNNNGTLPQFEIEIFYNRLGTCTFEFKSADVMQDFLQFLKK